MLKLSESYTKAKQYSSPVPVVISRLPTIFVVLWHTFLIDQKFPMYYVNLSEWSSLNFSTKAHKMLI